MVSVAVEVAPLTVLAPKVPMMVLEASRVKVMGLSDPPPTAETWTVMPPAIPGDAAMKWMGCVCGTRVMV